MRKVHFAVPAEVISEFAEKMTAMDVRNTIVGVNEDKEVEIEVFYEKNETEEVDFLEEYLEELIDSIEETDEEE